MINSSNRKAIIVIFSIGIALAMLISFYAEYFPLLFSPLLVIISVVISCILHKSFLTPLVLMSLSWLLPPLTTFLEPKYSLKTTTWLVIYGSFLSFVLSYMSVLLTVKSSVILPRFSKNNMWTASFTRHVIYVLFMVSITAFTFNMWRVFKQGGIYLYLTAGLRTVEYIFGANPIINQFFFLCMLVSMLSVIYTLIYGFHLQVVTLGFISFLILFPQGVRGNIIRTALQSLLIYFLVKRKLNWKWLIAIIILVYLTFALITVARDPYSYMNSQDLWEFQKKIFQKMYLYIAPNFANLQEEMINRDTFLYGKETGYSLIKILTLDGVLMKTHLLERPNYFLVDDAYKVGTYLRDFYIDFGIAGLVIGPFFLGAVSALIFLQYVRYVSMRWFFIYTVLLTMIAFTWWFNEFKNIQLLFFIVIVWIIDKMHKTKRGKL